MPLTTSLALVLLVAGPAALGASPNPSIERALVEPPAIASHAHLEGYLPVARRFYAARQFQPLWTTTTGLSGHGRSLLAALHQADEEGLTPSEYLVEAIDSLSRVRDAQTASDLDVLLSLVALRFGHDLGWGVVVPGEVDRDNDYSARPFNADTVLAALATAPDPGRYLLQLAPLSTPYRRLRSALAELRAIDAKGGWTAPVPAGPALKPRAKGPRVAELRTLLVERGDLPASAAKGDSFDLVVARAVVQFQNRHGLEPDTVFGAQMVNEFRVPLSHRIQQVRFGMERMRWLPHDFTGRWIGVNLADFRAYVWDGDQAVYESRTVIGKKYHETPMFNGIMTYVVINPYWNVPPSIARGEILPKANRDPGYLSRNHMERVPGGGVRQLPGEWNSLGRFKFMFPNAHNVYLHDTPSKPLFERADRAFSHGCVRLQKPAELAEVLLKGQGWTPERIAATVASGKRTAVTLDQPIPVYIRYATAFHGPDGLLHYRRDVYGRDAKLAAALERRGAGSWEE
jgi:murein L,D-transpeptidase YcbB/YkuD